MSTPSTRTGLLRGGLVAACSVLITSLAHAAAGGGIPTGSAMVELLIVCATVGAGISAIEVEGRLAKAASMVAALCVGQGLGHLVLAVVGGHQHAGAATAMPGHMVVMHAVAALILGLLIGAAEYLFVVCSSILSWLRLFATATLAPSVAKVTQYSNVVVLQPVLMRASLGMRAPPRCSRWVSNTPFRH